MVWFLVLWRQLTEGLNFTPGRILFLAIDILLVIYFIWRLFLVLRGIKGVAFLNVLAGLLILQVISGALPLPLFSRLLQLLGPMLLVAFPVVFQPELRRALEQMGRRNLFSRLLRYSQHEESRFLNSIVQAAAIMAQNRVGALIVLERDQELSEIAATGVRLDAAISSELIRQVFATNGPLHDGALLVKGQRILAAACLLPLSDRSDLGTGIGTRHRAGLGIAETTDALAIVISEERGTISLASDGQLERGMTQDRLTMRLAELLAEESRASARRDLRAGLRGGA